MKKMKIKMKIGTILIILGFFAIIVGTIFVDRYVIHHKYEIINTSPTETQDEINAVLKVLQDGNINKQ